MSSLSSHDLNDHLYEGYNDNETQLHSNFQSQIGLGESKADSIGSYDQGPIFNQLSFASNIQEQMLDPFSKSLTLHTTTSMLWQPPSTSMSSQAQHSPYASMDSSRPMTGIHAAGYSSRGSKFDPMNQGSKICTLRTRKKEETNAMYQFHEMEQVVNQLLEASAVANLAGDFQTSLQKAKEASKKERHLCKTRKQAGLVDQVNIELTFAVCFNLGYQYQCGGLQCEALNTYTQFLKNNEFTHCGRLKVNMGNIYYKQKRFALAVKMYRMALDETSSAYKETRYQILRNIGNALMRLGQYQDAIQAFELVVENKIDHQTTYNLIVGYFVVGNRVQMKNCFTKMLLVKYYDSDSDDENDEENSILRNDELQEALREKHNQNLKYILTAARLIAPVLFHNFVEGYDWVVEGLKDQQYDALANEMEMDKAIQHLHRRDFPQAIVLLKEFEHKENDLKARAATNLSFLYFLEGEISNAEKYAEVALRTNCYNAQALVNKGNCLYNQGHIEEAKVIYCEATNIELNCVEAIYNLGLCHKKLGAFEDALSTFNKLSNFLPNNIEVLFQVGQVNELMGNTRQAIKCLELVNTHTLHDAGVLAMLGSLHAKCNDEPKALHYYNESHRVYPTNMDITSWLGAYFVKNEVYEKAMPFFDLASKIHPNEVKWQLMVASCLQRTGSYIEALAKYKSILLKHPENIECLRHLLHMCSGLGRRDEVQSYEAQLRKVEMDMASESRSQILRLEPAKGVLVRSIEFRGESQNSTRDDTDFSSKSSQSSSLGSRVVNSNFFISSSMSSSPLPQRTLKGITEKKTINVEEDVWPELGDDLLPI